MIPADRREQADALVELIRAVAVEVVRDELAVLAPPPREWLTLADAADYLSISQRTLERLIAKGEIRSAPVERRRIVKRDWLDEYATAREEVARTTPQRRRRARQYGVPTTPNGGL